MWKIWAFFAPDTCWIFELYELIFLTIFKPRVDQVLGDLQQLVPVLVHDPANLRSSLKVETLDPPVMPGGPPAAADEQEDDEEDDQVDGGEGKAQGSRFSSLWKDSLPRNPTYKI